MEYEIYGKDGAKIEPLQNCTSIQWSPKYNDTGKVEIHARATDYNITYLQPGMRIVCKDRKEIAFIESVSVNGDEIEVRGTMNNLNLRINDSTATHKNIEKSLLTLVENNKRGLDVTVASPKGYEASIQGGSETTYDTLRESFEEYCKIGGLGFRQGIGPNMELNYVEIYEGKQNLDCRFSDDLGNLTDISIEKDLSEYKNYAIVLGEDEGESRKKEIVDIHTEDEEIRELYVDARDLQSEYEDDAGNQLTYSDEEYKQMLLDRGKKKLDEANEKAFTFSFSIDTNATETFVLGKDYDLGDIVTVQSKLYGIIEFVRIVGINFVEEQNKNVDITLDTERVELEVIE